LFLIYLFNYNLSNILFLIRSLFFNLYFFLSFLVKILLVFNFNQGLCYFIFFNLTLIIFICKSYFSFQFNTPIENFCLPFRLFFILIFTLILLITIFLFWSFCVINFFSQFHPLASDLSGIELHDFFIYSASKLMTQVISFKVNTVQHSFFLLIFFFNFIVLYYFKKYFYFYFNQLVSYVFLFLLSFYWF